MIGKTVHKSNRDVKCRHQRSGVRDASMWTAIPAVFTSLRGARLRDAVRVRAARTRARTRTEDAGTDGSATPGATIIWRHCDKHATTRPHFDVRQ